MDESLCPGCRLRDARIAAFEQRVAELEALVRQLLDRLNTNSKNSSLPPSANPLGAAKPVVKKKKGKRKPGGQPGHPPHLKQLLPIDQVDNLIPLVPTVCEHCDTPLSAKAGANDPEPTRHQLFELPPKLVEITEWQGHARTCECCGHVNRAVIPADIRAHSVGPRLVGTLSYMAGELGVSKRGVAAFADEICGAPLCVGTVCGLEQEMSAALAPAHHEAIEAVRNADVKNVDETSWKVKGAMHWLWAAATATVAAFVIHARRSALGLTALLGEALHGVHCSDRWGVYGRLPVGQRQLCWAHLKRDFQKVVDRGGGTVKLGQRGLRVVRDTFKLWHQFRGGGITRAELQSRLGAVQNRMNLILVEGLLGDAGPVATFCENVLALEDALWTFARIEGVEPTNNHIERLLRKGVLWRKRSFGCSSAAGCRFVERILTVVQTRRLQKRRVLDFLHASLQAHRTGAQAPKLLAIR
jgi:transposase